MYQEPTIFGLSSGSLPSGVAVVRISGPEAGRILQLHGVELPEPRRAILSSFRSCENGEIIDRGLCMWFPGPHSFTGEDVAELHVHGGKAVVEALFRSLLTCDGVRMAEAGEFSRRAFNNHKFDLTEAEGLSDLLAAQTEQQRKQAFRQSEGHFRKKYEAWRQELVRIRAMLEAEIDFADEDDVSDDVANREFLSLEMLREEIEAHLEDDRKGEIIREGFRIVIMGPPNAGKSSLLNALAQREVAIVTDEAGTTRDLLEVNLDLNGYAVIVTDTAGIRESDNVAEREGIRRARKSAAEADLVIWLNPKGSDIDTDMDLSDALVLFSKDDTGSLDVGTSISSKSGYGLDWLTAEIGDIVRRRATGFESSVISRSRHRAFLTDCLLSLTGAIEDPERPIELTSELLRSASDSLGRITGTIDVEDLLDVIFSEFCIGK